MIELTRLNGERYILNSELIEMIEMLPDTLVTMTNGKTHYVKEPAEEVVARISAYKAGVMAQARLLADKLNEGQAKENYRRRYERMKED